MAKQSKTYRLSEKTLHQIDWLAGLLGDVTATDVITIAVADLYERKRADLPMAELVPSAEGDLDLRVRGETVMDLSEETLGHLPKEVREDLFAGRAQIGDALVHLVLAAARGGERIGVNQQALGETFDGSRAG